jgi:hypothetical protein
MKLFHLIFTRQNTLRAVFAIALLLTLWAAFCLEERRRGQRKWHAYREVALAHGAKLDLKDVLPPDVPDAENFAAIPMIRELFAAREAGNEPPKWFVPLKLQETRPPGWASPTAPVDLVRWRDNFVKHGVLAVASDDVPGDVLKAIALVEPERTALHEAGRRSSARFPVRWELGFSAMVPHLEPLRAAALVEQLAMSAHLAKGDSAAAYACFRHGLRFYEALRNEPMLITGLYRIALLGALEDGVREGLRTGKWAEAELRRLDADFAALRLIEDWRTAVEGERAILNTTVESLKMKSDSELASLLGEVAPNSGMGNTGLTLSFYPRGWIDLSMWKLNTYFDATLARIDHVNAGGPPPNDDPGDMLKVIKGKGVIASLPYVLALLAGPAIIAVEARYLEAFARISQTRTALALESHRLAHGTFPEKLDALGEVPRDPMDQKPMRYRRTESGYELWSVALNRTDDGAKTLEDKSAKEQPDWVFRR